MADTRKAVLVDAETYARFQAYSNTTGSTVTHAINEALSDWMDVVGAARLEAFAKPVLRDNVLVMPTPQAPEVQSVS